MTTFDTGCIGGDEGLPDTPVDSASEKVGYLLVCEGRSREWFAVRRGCVLEASKSG